MGSAGGDLQGVQRKAHMTTDPTRDRVKAILTLADAATEGPWNPAIAPAETSTETPAEYLANALCGAGPLWVTWCANDTDDGFDHLIPVVTGDGPTSEINARFIAAARSETPWLAARLLEALDENERLHDETVDILLPLVTYLCDHHSERYGGRHCVDVALELLREYEGER